MCKLEDFSHLKLDPLHRAYVELELPLWHKAYISPRVKGGIVLDIGAGNGETVQLFLNHGAKFIIAIEPDADLLYYNFGNDPRVLIIPFAVDMIKSDFEGGEEDMAVEVHFPHRIYRYNSGAIFVFRRENRPILKQLKSRDVYGRRPQDRIGVDTQLAIHRAKVKSAHTIRIIYEKTRNRRNQ